MKLTEKEIQKLIISNETSLNEMIQKITLNNHKILLVKKIDKLIGYITPLMLKIELQSFGLDYDTNAEKIIAQLIIHHTLPGQFICGLTSAVCKDSFLYFSTGNIFYKTCCIYRVFTTQ